MKSCTLKYCPACDAIEIAFTAALTPTAFYVGAGKAPGPYVERPDGRYHAPVDCDCSWCTRQARIASWRRLVAEHPATAAEHPA